MKKKYLLDTNVVIALSKYHISQGDIESLTEEDGFDYYKALSIKTLYNLIKNNEIEAYVPYIVVDELKQGINKYGMSAYLYYIQSEINLIQNIPPEVLKIINDLGNYYTKFKSKSAETIFQDKIERYNGKNDAFIMAFASITGLNIITFDKHFTKKFFTIREANDSFMQKYLKKYGKLSLVSKKFNEVKIHKPTHILKLYGNSYEQ